MCRQNTYTYLKRLKRFFCSFVLFFTKANRKEYRERLREADSTAHLVLPKFNRKKTLMKADEGRTEQSLRLTLCTLPQRTEVPTQM